VTAHRTPELRTAQLIDVALALAATDGLRQLTRERIAQTAGVSPALVSARLGTMEQLRRSVMRAAVRQRVVPVVAEGLAVRDKHAQAADEELRALAAEWVRQG
jgi:AcrR family transcriptional regulator